MSFDSTLTYPHRQHATPFLVAVGANNDEWSAKKQESLAASLKYIAAANAQSPAESAKVTELKLPKHLRDGISKWLESKQLPDDDQHNVVKWSLQSLIFTTPSSTLKISSSTASPLLSLPPELRNRIYRYVLVTRKKIRIKKVSQLPAEPPLLRTCRLVRQEARAIWHCENVFHFSIKASDASHFIAWCRRSKLHSEGHHAVRIDNVVNWDNLKAWLEAYYADECGGLRLVGDSHPSDVGAHMFNAAVEMFGAGLDWADAEKVLDHVIEAFKGHGIGS